MTITQCILVRSQTSLPAKEQNEGADLCLHPLDTGTERDLSSVILIFDILHEKHLLHRILTDQFF